MSIKTNAVLHRSAVFTDDQGREFNLPVVTEHVDDFHGPLVSDLPNGNVLVSYMVLDDDAWYLGDDFKDPHGWQQFTILESQRDADALSAQLNECGHCGEDRHDHGSEGDEDAYGVWDHDWVPNDAAKALEAGRAFFFEKYEHGMVRYALLGESSQVDRQWDVTPVAGFLWADDDWGEGVDLEQAARDFLQSYTDWCNGNVWGIVHVEFTDQQGLGWSQVGDDETCWGYIGDDHAAEIMKEEHEWRLSN